LNLPRTIGFKHLGWLFVLLTYFSSAHAKPVYFSQVDSYFDTSIDKALLASTRQECLSAYRKNIAKIKEINGLHSSCLKTPRSGKSIGQCTHPQCEQLHIFNSTYTRDVYLARTACYARVKAREALENELTEILPSSVQKAAAIQNMWSTANSLKQNCSSLAESRSVQSCLSATGNMVDNLRGLLSPGGVVKAIQDEAFARVLEHHNYLATQIDQLSSSIKDFGPNPTARQRNTWKLAVRRSNSELLDAGWSKDQVAQMRSWQSQGGEQSASTRDNYEEVSLRESLMDQDDETRVDNRGGTRIGNQAVSARIKAFNQSVISENNRMTRVASNTSENSSLASPGNDSGGAGCAAEEKRVERRIKTISDRMKNLNSACLALRGQRDMFKVLLEFADSCPGSTRKTGYTRSQLVENINISNDGARNVCTDG